MTAKTSSDRDAGPNPASSFLVGRQSEMEQIRACLKASRNVLLEGPVGVGKTHLALVVPRLGEIQAREGFLVIATQNPKEFVATSHLSEAILDRFELVVLDYQSEADETAIVSTRLQGKTKEVTPLATASVRLARMTRN